jgi:plastocyanin
MMYLKDCNSPALQTFSNHSDHRAFFLFVTIIFAVLASTPLQAATNVVRIREIGAKFVFDPTNLTINPGDSIKWTNTVVNQHDSTHRPPAGPLLWGSPSLSSTSAVNNSFSFTFTNTGFYPYYCFRHVVALATNPEQTGTVTVVSISLTAANLSPPGMIQFQVGGGRTGQRCIIDAADTLPNWAPISTNTFPTNSFVFTNNAALFNRRFYRARVSSP